MDCIEICGVKFDTPTKDDLLKRWNYKEWKEGRSTYKEMWIDRYEKIGTCLCRQSHCLLLKNGSIASLDGKRLIGKDLEEAKKVLNTKYL